MRRRCVALHEANGGHTKYWLVFWSTPLSFFKVSVTNRHISVFPVMWNPEIKGLMNLFQFTYFLIWTVTRSTIWDCCMLRLYFCSV
jgi:hypothetical protein